jgi:hypothetical protein
MRHKYLPNQAMAASYLQSSLCHEWARNGIILDTSDFSTDFHQFGQLDVGERSGLVPGILRCQIWIPYLANTSHNVGEFEQSCDQNLYGQVGQLSVFSGVSQFRCRSLQSHRKASTATLRSKARRPSRNRVWPTPASIFSQHLKLEKKQHEFQLQIPLLGTVVIITRWIR